MARGYSRPPLSPRQKLFVYNGGFLKDRRIAHILKSAGYDLSFGLPKAQDLVGVWGHSPTSKRGEAVAARQDVPIVRVEDPFLRSLKPGRMGEPSFGLLVDHRSAHYDSRVPSDLEKILTEHALDDTALLDQARAALALIRRAHLSKYNLTRRDLPLPELGYVLVIDQIKGDASISKGGANADRFAEMLLDAQLENPNARIVVKSHPEAAGGLRAGHFTPKTDVERISYVTQTPSPWDLLDGATKVYTVSSQMGFEAIMAGHKPIVFGQPFYAGWGLTEDRFPVTRRQRKLSRAQLFAAAQILYPYWYDPHEKSLCSLDQVIYGLEAQTRAWREDSAGWQASGVRLWKRPHFKAFFGTHAPVRFSDNSAEGSAKTMRWAKTEHSQAPAPDVLVEDGFLRSKGLGAELVPPLSLALDDLGIYYDPSKPSRLERLIEFSPNLPEACLARSHRLIRQIVKTRVTKYNLPGLVPELKTGYKILVPGQVEDDASVRLGGGEIQTNRALLERVRYENPEAVLIYKPHPDVVAGLRPGALSADAIGLADQIVEQGDPISLLHEVNEVWTLTSLLGFEALIRGMNVTTLGQPFYAGWGLTRDLGAPVPRRTAKVTLPCLVHAALIDYPRYYDPVLRRAASPETVVRRLSSDASTHASPSLRILSKAQGVAASIKPIWR
ncbi:MAG: capsular polysaccharide biosynthesis protein [Pseudomonadota bacterium]